MLPLSHPLIASFMFLTDLLTHFVPVGTLSKLTSLNPFMTLLPVLVLLADGRYYCPFLSKHPMMYPFLIPPADGDSFGIDSLLRLMASLSSVMVSSSTLPLPLILLLTLLGLMPFPFSTPQLVSLARSPSRTFLPTLLVVPLPSAKCFPFHAGHHLPHHVSLMAFYRLSFPLRL
jgi:hypothetical protein